MNEYANGTSIALELLPSEPLVGAREKLRLDLSETEYLQVRVANFFTNLSENRFERITDILTREEIIAVCDSRDQALIRRLVPFLLPEVVLQETEQKPFSEQIDKYKARSAHVENIVEEIQRLAVSFSYEEYIANLEAEGNVLDQKTKLAVAMAVNTSKEDGWYDTNYRNGNPFKHIFVGPFSDKYRTLLHELYHFADDLLNGEKDMKMYVLQLKLKRIWEGVTAVTATTFIVGGSHAMYKAMIQPMIVENPFATNDLVGLGLLIFAAIASFAGQAYATHRYEQSGGEPGAFATEELYDE